MIRQNRGETSMSQGAQAQPDPGSSRHPQFMREKRALIREHRRRRMRRRGRRAYIRSVYFLPSLATLGNAVCGFAAMYISTLDPTQQSSDWLTRHFANHRFTDAAYLIF